MSDQDTYDQNKAQPTCAERVRDEYKSRLEDFQDLLKRTDTRNAVKADAAWQETMEFPLEVEIVKRVKVLLSTGGPGDWLEANLDDDGRPYNIEYHFNDWFDHASIRVDDDATQWFVEQFTGY